jgi:hypothetical protein
MLLPISAKGRAKAKDAKKADKPARRTARTGTPADAMTDIETLIKVIHQIELILADHVEPGYLRDPYRTIGRIFTVMDEHDAVKAVDRLQAGYAVRVVK